MAAQRGRRGRRALEIHARAAECTPQRGAGERLFHQVDREAVVVPFDDRQARAGHIHARVDREVLDHARRGDLQAHARSGGSRVPDRADLLDDPGEHD